MTNISYDNVGNIKSVKYKNSNPDINNYTFNYKYDNLNRLRSFNVVDGIQFDYKYDKNGNVKQLRNESINISSSSNQIDKSGYVYGPSGNMTYHDNKDVDYNWKNMMTEYGNNSYTYNPYKKRVRKEESGNTRYYVNSGNRTIEEYNDAKNISMSHIYCGSKRVATVTNKGKIYYNCSNQVQSSGALIDGDGNNKQGRIYYPYGETAVAQGDKLDYQFSGKEKDGTGLYYFGSRYYDPTLGAWLTPDPAGQVYSPYPYCGGNPINMKDPDGEWVVSLVAFTLWGGHI